MIRITREPPRRVLALGVLSDGHVVDGESKHRMGLDPRTLGLVLCDLPSHHQRRLDLVLGHIFSESGHSAWQKPRSLSRFARARLLPSIRTPLQGRVTLLRCCGASPKPLHVVLPLGRVADQHFTRQNDAEGGPTRLGTPPPSLGAAGLRGGAGGGEFIGSRASAIGSAGASPSRKRLDLRSILREPHAQSTGRIEFPHFRVGSDGCVSRS